MINQDDIIWSYAGNVNAIAWNPSRKEIGSVHSIPSMMGVAFEGLEVKKNEEIRKRCLSSDNDVCRAFWMHRRRYNY